MVSPHLASPSKRSLSGAGSSIPTGSPTKRARPHPPPPPSDDGPSPWRDPRNLPFELWLLIEQHLGPPFHRQASLAALSAASSSWKTFVIPRLYEHPHVRAPTAIHMFERSLRKNPSLGFQVRTLRFIHATYSAEWQRNSLDLFNLATAQGSALSFCPFVTIYEAWRTRSCKAAHLLPTRSRLFKLHTICIRGTMDWAGYERAMSPPSRYTDDVLSPPTVIVENVPKLRLLRITGLSDPRLNSIDRDDEF
ncbi:hypothetical protein V8E36_000729 [Tilletia maclaganii]